MADRTRGGGRPTLEQVAARAGVGRGTVSRVINGSPKVSEHAKAAVQQAIADLGYVPNRTARALAAGSADAVALVIPEPETRLFAEPYFSGVIRGVSAALSAADKQLLLALIGTPAERERLTHYLSRDRVDGVLLVSVHQDDPLPARLEELGLPLVLNGRRHAQESLPYVDSDNTGGARAAVEHLLARGRRRIATITGPQDMYVAQCRLEGWRQALAAAGVAAGPVAIGDFTEDGGRRAMRDLLDQRRESGAPPDAVFAASDLMAAGALQVLRAAGLRVPGDVAVVGFEDSPVARHMDPPLTSVRQPTEEMGRAMVRLLLGRLDADAAAAAAQPSLVLPTDVVVRASA
ncbi:LacI family transcriptional regulator [Streptomyces sp. A7024]|uniref:LacI family transcriptional regulator n=1 Tax=Streptomyces coryli TaxID=1128680 RepID=A0A6G4U9P5_9ACTN|nr:LacI family DNA-binding transcriptional regulator [Streptomyces coryli]NGN68965.1 LacI family transcriptional regulator [Streptomyces coryli]